MKKLYNIHDLVEIIIHDNVNKWIVRDIEFQIGFFLTIKKSEKKIPKIEIYPYSEFSKIREKHYSESLFYKDISLVGKYLNIVNEKLCIYNNDGNFKIFADYSNFLINLFIQILIVKQGYTMIHASGFKSSSGLIHIIAGAGGVGKTSIVSHAAINKKLKILGDDILIISNEGECLAFPREFVLKTYHSQTHKQIFKDKNISLFNLYKLKRFIIDNLPFLALLKKILKKLGIYYSLSRIINPAEHLATISANKMFGNNSIEKKGKIGKIFYLDRIVNSSFSIDKQDAEILSNRIFSIINHEWIHYMPQLFSMGANNVVNLSQYMSKLSTIFSTSVMSKDLFQVNIPNNIDHNQLIDFFNKKNIF